MRTVSLPVTDSGTTGLHQPTSPAHALQAAEAAEAARLVRDQLDACVSYARGLQRNYEAVSLRCKKNSTEIKARPKSVGFTKQKRIFVAIRFV